MPCVLPPTELNTSREKYPDRSIRFGSPLWPALILSYCCLFCPENSWSFSVHKSVIAALGQKCWKWTIFHFQKSWQMVGEEKYQIWAEKSSEAKEGDGGYWLWQATWLRSINYNYLWVDPSPSAPPKTTGSRQTQLEDKCSLDSGRGVFLSTAAH